MARAEPQEWSQVQAQLLRELTGLAGLKCVASPPPVLQHCILATLCEHCGQAQCLAYGVEHSVLPTAPKYLFQIMHHKRSAHVAHCKINSLSL